MLYQAYELHVSKLGVMTFYLLDQKYLLYQAFELSEHRVMNFYLLDEKQFAILRVLIIETLCTVMNFLPPGPKIFAISRFL